MWAEVIKKENAMIGVPHKFFLNPNKLVFIARKPTEVDPRTYEADSFSTGNANVRAKNRTASLLHVLLEIGRGRSQIPCCGLYKYSSYTVVRVFTTTLHDLHVRKCAANCLF